MATARRPPAVGRALRAMIAVAALGAVAVAAVVWALGRAAPPAVADACYATVDETRWRLTPEQAANAATITAVSLRRDMPARAATIGIATAIQESSLRNLDHGDRDSLGLFQQRPSQGWGSAEQVQDPVYAADAFFAALARVPDYTTLEITVAAQTVQRSAFPDAYAQHEGRARAYASALTGYSPGALTCQVAAAQGQGEAAVVAAAVIRDFGELPVQTADDATVVVDAGTLPGAAAGADRLGWAVGHWAVAWASALDLAEVQVADQVWTREAGAWGAIQPDDGAALPAGQVRLVLAGR